MSEKYLYYLVYKLKTSSTLWISGESTNVDDLYRKIYNFISDKENYYIIRKKYTNEQIDNIFNTKFKGFKIFNLDEKCEIIYKTKNKINHF